MAFDGVEASFNLGIQYFLGNVMTLPGKILHWGIITTTATNYSGQKYGQPSWTAKAVTAMGIANAPLAGTKTASVMNAIAKSLLDPNLEGVPISTASITMTRDVEIAQTPVITGNGYSRYLLVDNSVPKPRRWTVSGFLTSTLDIDAGLIIKPTILIQEKLLDAIAQSRRPAWFKTAKNEFVLVQIASLQLTEMPEAQNATKIDMTLQEFVCMEVNSKSVSGIVATLVG